MQRAIGSGFEYLAEMVLGKLVESRRKQRRRINFSCEVDNRLARRMHFSEVREGKRTLKFLSGDVRSETGISVPQGDRFLTHITDMQPLSRPTRAI